MNYTLWTRHEPCMVKVVIKTNSPQVIRLKVFDDSHPDTYFTDRTKTINGKEDLFVRMPLAPWNCKLSIYNEKNGNLGKGEDSTFEVVGISKEELDITLPETRMDTMQVRSFVAFAQKFCYNAGWIAANRDYTSGVGGYKIEYLPYITKQGTNQRLATPARISTKNGRIQISQEAFKKMTIPMRMAILLHEFSHYYLNSDISNETEADLNGLTIYLGLGYPIREAYAAFGETFIGYPSEQNKQRYEIINKFIRDYVDEYKIKDVYAVGN